MAGVPLGGLPGRTGTLTGTRDPGSAVRRVGAASWPTIPVDVGRPPVAGPPDTHGTPRHHDAPIIGRRPTSGGDHRRHRGPVGHRPRASACGAHRGRGHLALLHRGGPTGDRRLRARRVEPWGTGPGARPLAESPEWRAVLLPGSRGPGPARRTRTRQRHPRTGPVDALADGGPGPEPGQPGVRAAALAGLPLRPPADRRVPPRAGRTHRGHGGGEPRGRRPSLRVGIPPVPDRGHPHGGPGAPDRAGRPAPHHRRPRSFRPAVSRWPVPSSTSPRAGSSG